ncbi:hypothetical protein MASR2M79_23230 [Aminivibrio sp.]
MKADLVIRNGLIYANGEFFKGGVAVKDGKTAVICGDEYLPEAETVLDAGGNPVLPGVVDTHVHVRIRAPRARDFCDGDEGGGRRRGDLHS